MFRKVDTWADLIALEHRVLDFWKETNAFDALRELNKDGEPWSFLDGPITANNPMGVHHAWGRTLKDCFNRFHAMLGHKLRYQNGFDCQGLWVEVEVEKEKGFKNKREIEQYGVAKFVDDCKARVRKYSAVQTDQSIRLGYWMDWNDSYYTMSDENNYTIWSFLKKCHDRGLVYRGKDVMPWCARCGTGISQHEMQEGYKERKDPSVVLRFPLRGRAGESLLVWTTTPWTLTSNVAAAVHPEFDYVKARHDGRVVYMAEKLVPKVLKGEVEILGRMKGRALEGWAYDGPFDELPAQETAKASHRVVLWDAVSEEDGTGIVHIAPGCGKEDFELGRTLGLPAVMPIDDLGLFLQGFGPFTGTPAAEAEKPVLGSLKEKGILHSAGKIDHSYPHCWRCSTPLLFRLVDEWYIAMDPWREEIMEVAKKIRWIPSYGMDLELDWLKNMRDWMISKKRYWGLALPIWTCADPNCGHFDVVGGRDELRSRAVEGWEAFDGKSPHKPFIDEVKIACTKCGGKMNRVPDVGNPWLDAGIVPYSTMKYGSDRAYWEKWFPAKLVLECFPGQFRNWFYALLAMSTMMENRAPFETLLGHALVRDELGEEMHKSKGNAIWFDEAVEKMGADVMRWIYCSQDPVKNLNFGYAVGRDVRGRFLNTLWNVYSFFCNYAVLSGYDPAAPRVPAAERADLDRWILSNLQKLLAKAKRDYAAFDARAVCRAVEGFVDQLSNWYVRRSRRRFWDGTATADGRAAHDTLYEVLVALVKTVAPVMPFLAEEMYQNLKGGADAAASVHHCRFPEADPALRDERASAEMDSVFRVTSLALAARKGRDIRVRQPLPKMTVKPKDAVERDACRRYAAILADEINVKEINVREPDGADDVSYAVKPNFKKLGPKFGRAIQEAKAAILALPKGEIAKLAAGAPAKVTVAGAEHELLPDEVEVVVETPADLAVQEEAGTRVTLVTALTPELVREGLMRDLLRRLQAERKERGLEIEDRIRVRYRAEGPTLALVVKEWRGTLADELLAVSFDEAPEGEELPPFEIQGETFRALIEKAI